MLGRFLGKRADPRDVMNMHFLLAVLGACQEGSHLLIDDDKPERWEALMAKPSDMENSQLGFNKHSIDPRLMKRMRRLLKRNPGLLRSCHGMSIEGHDGRLLMQSKDGFTVVHLVDDLMGTFATGDGRKIIGIVGNRLVTQSDPGLPQWRVDVRAAGTGSERERMKRLFRELLHEFAGVFVVSPGRDPSQEGLKGTWRAADESTWCVPADSDPDELYRWLGQGNWLLYAADQCLQQEDVNRLRVALSARLPAETKRHGLAVLIRAADLNDHWDIAVST